MARRHQRDVRPRDRAFRRRALRLTSSLPNPFVVTSPPPHIPSRTRPRIPSSCKPCATSSIRSWQTTATCAARSSARKCARVCVCSGRVAHRILDRYPPNKGGMKKHPDWGQFRIRGVFNGTKVRARDETSTIDLLTSHAVCHLSGWHTKTHRASGPERQRPALHDRAS